MFTRLYFKGRSTSWWPGTKRGREEGGDKRRGDSLDRCRPCPGVRCQAATVSHACSWQNPGNKDRKKTRCLMAARRKSSSSGQGEGPTHDAKCKAWKEGLIPAPHPPGSLLLPEGPELKGSHSQRLRTQGGRKELPSLLAHNSVTEGFAHQVPAGSPVTAPGGTGPPQFSEMPLSEQDPVCYVLSQFIRDLGPN